MAEIKNLTQENKEDLKVVGSSAIACGKLVAAAGNTAAGLLEVGAAVAVAKKSEMPNFWKWVTVSLLAGHAERNLKRAVNVLSDKDEAEAKLDKAIDDIPDDQPEETDDPEVEEVEALPEEDVPDYKETK